MDPRGGRHELRIVDARERGQRQHPPRREAPPRLAAPGDALREGRRRGPGMGRQPLARALRQSKQLQRQDRRPWIAAGVIVREQHARIRREALRLGRRNAHGGPTGGADRDGARRRQR
jgi:hypothetical protein